MNFTAKLAIGLLVAGLAASIAPAKAQQLPIKQRPVRPVSNLPRSPLLAGNAQNQWIQCAVGATYVWWNPAWPAPYNTAAHAQTVCNTFYGGVGANQTAPTSGGPSNTPGQFNPTYAYPPQFSTNGVPRPEVLLGAYDMSIAPAIANAQPPVFPPVAATYNVSQQLGCGSAQNGGLYALNLNTGTANWRVKGPNYPAAIPSVAYANGAWPANLITAAAWISVNTDEMDQPDGGYLFSTEFTVPAGGATPVSVSGKFLADNQAIIFIDGIPVSTSLGQYLYGFYPAALTSFYYALPSANPGIHKIQILVRNYAAPTGLRAEVTVRRTCPLT